MFWSRDKILKEEGWTVDNAQSEYGQRAMARTEAIVQYCRKVGTKHFVRNHKQNNEPLFRYMEERELVKRIRTETIETVASVKSALDMVMLS